MLLCPQPDVYKCEVLLYFGLDFLAIAEDNVVSRLNNLNKSNEDWPLESQPAHTELTPVMYGGSRPLALQAVDTSPAQVCLQRTTLAELARRVAPAQIDLFQT